MAAVWQGGPMLLAVAALVCSVANADAPAASKDASKDASSDASAEAKVLGPSSDDRAAAATTSGIGAFVGVALGGVVVPGTAGLLGGFIGARPSPSDQLLLTTIGGASGAAVGGILGAIPTTTPVLGEAAVGGAAAVGALAGLVPAMFVAKLTPSSNDPNDPVKLAQSACLLTAIVASSAAAAGVGALLAEPKPAPVVK